MNIYPNEYITRVEEISIELLRKNNIKALMLDADNTLINYSRQMNITIDKWVENMKENDIKLYILSNSSKKDKIINIANRLDIEYVYFARKPLKFGFKKVQKKLDIPFENIAIVGDQIFTDIIGGNRCNMFSILVDPIESKDYWYTAFKRPIERKIVEKYLKIKQKNKGE